MEAGKPTTITDGEEFYVDGPAYIRVRRRQGKGNSLRVTVIPANQIDREEEEPDTE